MIVFGEESEIRIIVTIVMGYFSSTLPISVGWTIIKVGVTYGVRSLQLTGSILVILHKALSRRQIVPVIRTNVS
jgi:hypothetical protein